MHECVADMGCLMVGMDWLAKIGYFPARVYHTETRDTKYEYKYVYICSGVGPCTVDHGFGLGK